MARPQASGFTTRADVRARSRARSRRTRRLGLLALVLAILLPVLVLVLDQAEPSPPVPIPQADRLLPSGPPAPEVVALQGSLQIDLPIAQSKVTALGYHGVGNGALALTPVGTQANAGIFTRLVRRLFGESSGGVRYYLIGGGSGSDTGGLDVGAPVGTDVYAPVAGTVIGITDNVISGRSFGVRIDIQPSGSPGLVVSVEDLGADAGLTVGSVVVASHTKIGSVVDLSPVETAALARYTQDSGQHVHLEVHPASNLALP